MFSRAAKSIVKSIGQRNYHAGEETIKVAMSGSAGEVGRSLSPMLKQNSRLDVLALHDIPASKRYSSMPARIRSFSDGESANPIISRMLTMMDKSRYTVKDGQRSEGMQKSVSYSSHQSSKDAKKETDELVEALHRLPIAEEAVAGQPTKSKVVASQGDNAYTSEQRGPRVLGEMGPFDKFRHDGRIVSEIYKQFPNLATCFSKSSSKTMNRAAWRQVSSFPTRGFSTTVDATTKNGSCVERKRLNDVLPGSESNTSKYTDEFLLAKNNSMRKKIKKRGQSENTNADKLTASSELAVGESHLEEIVDAQSASMEVPEKRRIRDGKSKAWKTVEGTTAKVEKRPANRGKPRNWSIPAVLSDKKPKLLYGLVQRRQTPASWFFSKLFDAKNTDAIADTRSNRYRGLVSEAGKFGSVQAERLLEESKTRDEGRHNASTSTTSLGFPEKAMRSTMEGNSRSANEVDRWTRQDPDGVDKKTPSRSSSVSSETETISETSTSRNPLRNVSSKIVLFLENLRTSRQKSRSLSSLASYNLDSLFAPREAAQVAFFSSNGANFSLKDKFTKKFCGKKKTDNICKKKQQPSCNSKKRDCKKDDKVSCSKKNEPADCKKRDDDGSKQKCRSSCGEGANDPCKSLENKHHDSRCKEYEADKEYGSTEDPCKKYRREDIYGKSCKNGDDACKKHRKEEIYGKLCKEYRSEAGSEDLYDKYWRDDIYGSRCNKRKQKKSDLCDREKKQSNCSTERKEGSCSTERKESGCTSEKKATSCTTEKKSTSCTTEKKPITCTTENKPTACTTERKPTSCTTERKPTSCTTEKKPTSCTTEKKPSTCNTTRAARSCSTVKEARSCDRDVDPCGDGKEKKKKKKKEKKPKDCCTTKKKECPSVFRAPGCPKNDGKSGGSGSTPC
ncbi:uncharacterized protein LOC128880894 [Hylaeus volcanicus]|uniref:uncharacterized protein LOC128880894 n=1 Tax=Hylaeus volcanicus TaxID=313075 RepID=UPI0023B8592E|nr:uncharacterized protein LOC128880894 [Hylaeus volcanicus]